MKNIITIIFAISFIASVSSCRKSYHCDCVAGGVSNKGESAKLSKKDAETGKKVCESKSNSALNVNCNWITE